MQVSIRSNLDALSGHLKHNSPKAIQRASQASVNRTAATLRTQGKREIAEEVQSKRGGLAAIGRLIDLRKATKRGAGSQTAYLDFFEKGVPVEATRKASVRKVRGKAGRYRVTLRGQGTIKAFKLGDSSKPLFTRSGGKIKRLFAYTVIQEATKANVFDKLSDRAPELFIPQFLRLVDIFDGFNAKTGSDGRRR